MSVENSASSCDKIHLPQTKKHLLKITHPTLGYSIPPPLPAKVARRNARERNRVKQVNSGFEYLRSHIPGAADVKKMSKVDTLRKAVDYIQSLQRLLSAQSSRLSKEDRTIPDSGYETSSPSYTPSSITSPSSEETSSFVFPTPHPPDEYNHQINLYQQPSYASFDGHHQEVYSSYSCVDHPSEDELLDVIARWQET